MSMSHHNPEQASLIQRFQEQMAGTARREYPAGRMGAEDDGQIAYAIATDDRHRTIIIRFPKPVEWVAMGVQEAEELRQQLSERIAYLKMGQSVNT